MTPLEYESFTESRASAELRENYGIFIDGRFIPGTTEKPLPVLEPSTANLISKITAASPEDIERAVLAAESAGRTSWGRYSGAERAKCLYRLWDAVHEHHRQLAVLQTMASGRPLRLSVERDLPSAVRDIFRYAGWSDKLSWVAGWESPSPLGVIGCICTGVPPIPRLVRSVMPALAAGNTVVIAPDSIGSLTGLLFAEICQTVGIPAGTVNVLPGGTDIKQAFLRHPRISMVTFVGSRRLGQSLLAGREGTTTRLSFDFEAGGTAILFDDAPLDQAIEGIIVNGLIDRCDGSSSVSHLIVQENVLPETIERLRRRINRLRVGDPLDLNTDIGPLPSQTALDDVTEILREAATDGSCPWSPAISLPHSGYWHRPTIFCSATSSHRVTHYSGDAPILPISTFRTPREVVEMINSRIRGESVAIWTNKGSKATWIAERCHAAVANVNTINSTLSSEPSTPHEASAPASHFLLRYLKETK